MNKPNTTDWLGILTFVVRLLVSYVVVPFVLVHTLDIMLPIFKTTVFQELFLGVWFRIALEYVMVVITDVWYDKKYRK
jgi:hypothetical protein